MHFKHCKRGHAHISDLMKLVYFSDPWDRKSHGVRFDQGQLLGCSLVRAVLLARSLGARRVHCKQGLIHVVG